MLCRMLTLFLTVILSPVLVHAQTNVTDAVTEAAKQSAQDVFYERTGLSEVKDIIEVDPEKLADKAVEYAIGKVPSPLMVNLIGQIRDPQQVGLPSNFRPYTKKNGGFAGTNRADTQYFTRNACQRAANQKLLTGLDNVFIEGQLKPWVELSWQAIKDIAGGGKSIADLVKEHTKAKAEELIKNALLGNPKPKVETVTIPHYDECNTITRVTWDPVHMRLIVVTSGDCGCALSTDGDGSRAQMKNFAVKLVAPVTLKNVRIEEKNRFIFWRTYRLQAEYKVGKLNVATTADCNCSRIDDPPPPPPPPPPKEEKGLWGRFVDWLFGPNDSVDEPEDDAQDRDEGADVSVGTDDNGVTGDDILIDPKDDGEGTIDEGTNTGGDTDPEDNNRGERSPTTTDPNDGRMCGDIFTVDERQVQTYPYTQTNGELNFNCNNTCAPEEVCKVLPESVSSARAQSCVYCAQVCPAGEFRDRDTCERAKTSDAQECKSTGVQTWGSETCYRIVDKPSGSACVIPDDVIRQAYPPDVFTKSISKQGDRTVLTFTRTQCVSKSEGSVRQAAEVWLADFRAYCPATEISDISFTGLGQPCTTSFTLE